MLFGRALETKTLKHLLEAVKAGQSGVLVLRGEAGIGKTVLLESVADSGADMDIVRVVGVESEMELAFAGLHQLLHPLLDGLEQLPPPQRDALGAAFGLTSGMHPDKFLIALAALTLISDAAVERPILCLVDDVQWLDQASVEVLAFVARRLLADPVAMLFAVRDSDERRVILDGLPEVRLAGLPEHAARELLSASVGAPLDQRVARRIVSETAGNPLALVHLGHELTGRELARMAALREPLRIGERLEELFLARAQALPSGTRSLLLVAAADPSGEPGLVWRAAERLGIDRNSAEASDLDQLVSFAPSVRFRHPLMRSAIYHGASVAQRRRVHEALADVSDRARDPDRRAWHLASAAAAPDEGVAVELERSAGRAQARGGSAAAAALLQRAFTLTREPSRRVDRALAAGQASLQSGAFGLALGLVAAAEAAEPDELQRARADLLRGQIAFASGSGNVAPSLLLKAARRLEPLDLDLARATYLDAWGAAAFAGPAGASDRLQISRAASALPAPGEPRAIDLLLDSLACLVTQGRAVAAPALRRATSAFANEEVPFEERLRWGWLATAPTYAMWDNEGARTVLLRQIELVREAGALEQLPIYLIGMGLSAAWSGDFATAASVITESNEVAVATGAQVPPAAALLLLALQGQEHEASTLISAAVKQSGESGQGVAAPAAQWAAAVLYNGLGSYEQALAAAERACWDPLDLYPSMWALPELVEAAVRCAKPDLARSALCRLAATTRPEGTDWGLGIEARSRALVSQGESAELLYRDAIDRLTGTRERTDLARARLLYGEWLRRENRRVDARTQLRIAHDMFESIGMEGFLERARIELLATGGRVRKRTGVTRDELTPQEREVARLARDGLSNSEIGARLFVSSSTVAYHLRKVFRKLGMTSRTQLAQALEEHDRVAGPS